jgi:nicotinic acid mononucleotide adenylyltransferase
MTPETYKLLHIIIRTKIVNFILTKNKKFEINNEFIELITKNYGLDVFNSILKQENDKDKIYFIM